MAKRATKRVRGKHGKAKAKAKTTQSTAENKQLARQWAKESQDQVSSCTLLGLLAAAMPLLLAAQSAVGPALHSVELFAGKKAISRWTHSMGFRTEVLDKTYSKDAAMDITTPHGFQHALGLASRLVQGATAWAAPVCSSWVWVSRSSTGRSAARPAGKTSCPSVQEGNLMVKQTVAVLLVAFLRGAFVYVEQPCSSLMSLYEPMKSFIILIARQRCRVTLGAYGADSAKPIYIYTNDSNVDRFQKAVPKGTEFKQLCYKDASGSITGIKGVLKASQAYPEDFGKAVAAATASNILSTYGLDHFAA